MFLILLSNYNNKKDLLRFIRFDDLEIKEEKWKTSKLAAIKDVFNILICKRAYNPDAELCIDVM